MPENALWQPMTTAPETVDRLWLNHLTLGTIQVEGRSGRWYSPSRSHQVWRWYRPNGDDALEPFTGWLPFDVGDGTGDATTAPEAHPKPQ